MMDIDQLSESGPRGTATGKQKHLRVRRSLAEMALREAEGTKLPSVRELMSQFNVSQATADKALESLEAAGLIRREVGRGIFVARAGQSSMDYVDVLVFEDDNPLAQYHAFHTEVMVHLSRGLTSRSTGLRVHAMGKHSSDPGALEQLILDHQIRYMILVNARETWIDQVARQQGVLAVSLFSNTGEVRENGMQIDNERVMRLAIDHLTSLGHVGIAYLSPRSSEFYRDHLQRREVFYRLMLERQLQSDPAWTTALGGSEEEAYASTVAMLDADRSPTAIIAGDPVMPGVYRALGERGLRIGKDISLVGIDDQDFAAKMVPPLTSVRVARRRAADRLIQMLLQYRESATPQPAEPVPTDLVARESTGPCPTAGSRGA